MQIFLREFPVYKPKDSKFSIWSESYGGHYGPGFADYFEQQNRKNINGALRLKLDTVGIVNGCVDILEQMETYPAMAYENTYGLKLINESEYKTAMASWPGCKERVGKCRALAGEKDPKGTGAVKEVNTACREAFKFCFDNMWKPASDKGVSDLWQEIGSGMGADMVTRSTRSISRPSTSARSRQSTPLAF
jgi:carboxypeptidase D